VDQACSILGESTVLIETSKRALEHIFIPAYRYKAQFIKTLPFDKKSIPLDSQAEELMEREGYLRREGEK
jgi:hypothetical protein